MKKMRFVLGSLLTALIITSCSQPEDRYFISMAEAESIVPGSWRVDYYSGVEDQYTAYTFQYLEDGKFVANDGMKQFEGTWSLALATTDPNYDYEISIAITGNPELDELTGVWLVTDMNDVRMNLLDDSDESEVFFLKN